MYVAWRVPSQRATWRAHDAHLRRACAACTRCAALWCAVLRCATRRAFISFHFISCHLNSFHFNSFQFITIHLNSFHFISFHFISFHFISFQFSSFQFISVHFISFHFISFHFISFHIISYHFSSIQFNPVQSSSIQFNPVQFSSIQFNSFQFISFIHSFTCMCDLPFPCNGRKLLPQARLASARPPTPRDQKLPRTGKSHSRPAPSRSGRTDCGSRGSTARRSLCVPLPADRPGIWTSNLDIGLELRRKLRGCSPGRKNPRHQRGTNRPGG